MNIIKSFTTFLLASTILVGLSCAPKKGAIITFDGGSISEKDIEKKAAGQLYELRDKEYQILTSLASEAAQEKIFALEATKTGKPFKSMLQEYVNKNYRPPTEATIKSFYELRKAQIDQPFDEIKERLKQIVSEQEKSRVEEQFKKSIIDSYNMNIALKAPVAPVLEIDLEDDPSFGPKNAKVVIVEFSDFECPYCKRIQPDVKRIRAEFKDKIRWVFKDFPLSFHAQSMKAHIAANCAAKQNKFFPYQERVFSAGNTVINGRPTIDIGEENLKKIAVQAGLNVNQFNTCLADTDNSMQNEIQADIKYGSQIGVRGTPTIYINGRTLTGARSYDNFKNLINKYL